MVSQRKLGVLLAEKGEIMLVRQKQQKLVFFFFFPSLSIIITASDNYED